MNDNSSGNIDAKPLFNPKDTNQLFTRGFNFQTKRYIVEGWHLFLSNASNFLIYAALVIAFNLVTKLIPPMDSFIRPALIFLFEAILLFPFLMGIFVVASKKMKQQQTVFHDFFKGFFYFQPLAVLGIMIHGIVYACLFAAFKLSTTFSSLGYTVLSILLFSMGIYFVVAYLFSSMLVIDRKMTPWQAMETSRKIITGNWLPVFGLAAIMALFEIVGGLMLIIGLIPATAINICILTAAYDDIIGIRSTDF